MKQFSNEKNINFFFTILNDDLSINNEKFDQIFQETLQGFLTHVYTNDIPNAYKKREILQTLRYVQVC